MSEVDKLKCEVEKLRITLGSLIGWMAASANSPISISHATDLIKMMPEKDIRTI